MGVKRQIPTVYHRTACKGSNNWIQCTITMPEHLTKDINNYPGQHPHSGRKKELKNVPHNMTQSH
jgi:hypothetical protein